MFGRLAQLVERFIDVEEATGSNPVSPTNLSRSGEIMGDKKANSFAFVRI